MLILFIRYLSRVLPRLMPAEHEFLETLGMRPFFELSPLLCNDFRSNSAWNHAHNVSGAWPALHAAAREAPRQPSARCAATAISSAWA